jgi:DNA-binding transcriptional regulator GbsR (MarR family)
MLLNLGKYKKSEPYDQQILSILEKHNSLATDTIAILLGLTKCRTVICLKSLERFNLVRSVKRKTSYWRLNEEE